MAILVTLDPDDEERALIEKRLGDVDWLVDGADPRQATGMVSLWPRREMRAAGITWDDMPRLQWVKLITAGVNHVGWNDLPERVQVISTPGATGPIIAEYVLGGVIAWARGFMQSTHAIGEGHFQVGQPVRSVAELRVGIVGHGGVGQAIAHVLAAHGATVRAVSRSGKQSPDAPVEQVDNMDGLPAMASWADVLVLAVPLKRQTQGLVDASLLQRLGDGLLVNVARGHIVQEDALHAWLTGDPRRGAVLDTWWQYPRGSGRPFQEPFEALHNVIMTPHNSPNVTGFRLRMIERACQDILEARRSGTWRHVEDRRDYELVIDGDGR